jgi:uncharacterized protein YbaP (TraB family)
VTRLLILVALSFVALVARAAEPGPLLWQIQTASGEVLLLGSVHMLRAQDYPLAGAIEAAYERADRVVLELDLATLDPVQMQLSLRRLGMAEEGDSLETLMGPDSWRKATALAEELGVELVRLAAAKPWYAALTIANLEMIRLGFRPEHGIEQHFARLCLQDDKPIHGLETLDYQLGIFNDMALADQRRLLLQTLEDATRMEADMDGLIETWNRGDVERLGELLGEGFEEYGSLYETLVVRRNRQWLPTVESWAERAGTTLVVVGALHLVGEDSLIEMLRTQGHRVRRLPWEWPGAAARGGPAGTETTLALAPRLRPSRSLPYRHRNRDTAR